MLRENERFDQLIKEDFSIIQNNDVFSFSTDALLLGYFTEPRTRDIVLGLRSGNGVIPSLLFVKHPRYIGGVEVQKALVDTARRTFQFNGVDEYLIVHRMDLKNVTEVFKPSRYTLVTRSPPYFKENQQHQHRKEAHKIARHKVMCTLEDCMVTARHLLKEGDRLSTVHRAERLMDVLFEMRKVNIEPKEVVFIYSKVGKSARTVAVGGRKGGSQGLEIIPPFYIYNEDGNYSREMKEVYYG